MVETFRVMLQASFINSADGAKLKALVQNPQYSDEEDDNGTAGALTATV